jgi:hypothetical protein
MPQVKLVPCADRHGRRWLTYALAALVVASIGGCAGGGSGAAPSSPSRPAVSTSSAPTTTPTAAASPVQDEITGFGATQAIWSAHHTPDTRYDPGAAYDPMPGWGVDDRHNAKFFSVSYSGGRVDSYSMNMPAKATEKVAMQVVLSALPPDALILWTTSKASVGCFQAELQSKQLGLVLSEPAFGDPTGDVFVELDSDALNGGNPLWNPSNVTEAIVMLGSYPTAAQAPDC